RPAATMARTCCVASISSLVERARREVSWLLRWWQRVRHHKQAPIPLPHLQGNWMGVSSLNARERAGEIDRLFRCGCMRCVARAKDFFTSSTDEVRHVMRSDYPRSYEELWKLTR